MLNETNQNRSLLPDGWRIVNWKGLGRFHGLQNIFVTESTALEVLYSTQIIKIHYPIMSISFVAKMDLVSISPGEASLLTIRRGQLHNQYRCFENIGPPINRFICFPDEQKKLFRDSPPYETSQSASVGKEVMKSEEYVILFIFFTIW